jgi:hypothetical protein
VAEPTLGCVRAPRCRFFLRVVVGLPLGPCRCRGGRPWCPPVRPAAIPGPSGCALFANPRVPTLVFFSREPPQRRDAGAPCMALVHRPRRRGGSSAAIMQRPSKFVCLTHPLAAAMDSVFDNAAMQHMKLSVELCTGHVVQRRASDICRNQLSNG